MTNHIDKNLFQESEKKFEHHISIPDNKRIIFSGRFGIGKSTFIRNFFSRSERYDCVFLSPVNYSVSGNEDIFRYIKYDILIEMVMNDYPIETLKFTSGQTLSNYLHVNIGDLVGNVILNVIQKVPFLGKEVSETIEKLIGFAKKAKEHHENVNKTGIDSEIIKTFLKSVENMIGSIYETGIENDLIEQLLQRQKVNNQKQSVLIIDDLDRIDPDHIFRILNVFAAHLDNVRNETFDNKFGFDKVILICDIENIRNIFHHRFGGDVDFNGYIDKFYSLDVFNYLSRKQLSLFISKILGDIKFSSIAHPDEESKFRKYLFRENGFVKAFIRELCMLGLVNLRNVVKWRKIPFHFNPHENIGDSILDIISYPILLEMKFLAHFFGGKDSLASIVTKIPVNKFLFSPLGMSEFCYRSVAILEPENRQADGNTLLFSFNDKRYSIAMEEVVGERRINFSQLIPTQSRSNNYISLPVDGNLVKIAMLRYIEQM
jgi:hypothetical protein